MAGLVVNQGLQRIGINASQATGFDSGRFVRTMAVDDSTTAFAAATTTLGSPTNLFKAALDSTPTVTGQTVRHTLTIPAASGNFTIRRISLHDDIAANVTGSSTTLVVGIDGQSLTKTSDFSLTINVDLTYTAV